MVDREPKEKEPIGAWRKQGETYWLEVKHIGRYGRGSLRKPNEAYKTTVYNYWPKKDAIRITLHLNPHDSKLEVISTHKEVISKKVDIKEKKRGTINKLYVVMSNKEVSAIAISSIKGNVKSDIKYGFDSDGRPEPEYEHSGVVTRDMIPHFVQLGKTLPEESAVSLRNAVSHLIKP